jgi:hypothetical protein
MNNKASSPPTNTSKYSCLFPYFPSLEKCLAGEQTGQSTSMIHKITGGPSGLRQHEAASINTVTYRGFYSRWKFISVPKSQHTTVKYNQPFSKHIHASTLRDVPNKIPSTWPLLVIFQHELTFLQSESLQTQVRAQPLCSSGKNSHSCNQEASKHTCFSRNFSILTQSSNQQESVPKCTHASTLGDFQTWTDYKSIDVCRQQSRDHRNVSVSIVAYVTMLRIGPPFELLRC